MGGQVLLTNLTQPIGWEKEREKEREIERERKEERDRRNSRVRSSHFSVDFSAIGLSNSDETRGNADLHCKG